MSRGWSVGSDEYKQQMKVHAAASGGEVHRYAGLERDHVKQERAKQWEEQLRKLARAARIHLNALPVAKSHPEKSLLAATMKATTSVSNAWLADRLDMGEPASASQFARRYLRTSSGAKAAKALLSRFKT